MFDSVLDENVPKRKLGRGALMSFGVHALLLGLAVYASSRPKAGPEKLRAVTFFNPAPPPPPPPPPAGGGAVKKPKTEQKKIPKKPDTVVQTTKQEKVPEKPPEPTPEPDGQEGGVKGGVVGGVAGGVVGGTVGGVVGGTVGGTGTQVLPFGAGMVRPVMVKKPDIVFSREALAMHVSGVVLLNCVIETDGAVSDCKLTKGLPYMDRQLLEAARGIRYTPTMYQGHPQRISMTINLLVKAP